MHYWRIHHENGEKKPSKCFVPCLHVFTGYVDANTFVSMISCDFGSTERLHWNCFTLRYSHLRGSFPDHSGNGRTSMQLIWVCSSLKWCEVLQMNMLFDHISSHDSLHFMSRTTAATLNIPWTFHAHARLRCTNLMLWLCRWDSDSLHAWELAETPSTELTILIASSSLLMILKLRESCSLVSLSLSLGLNQPAPKVKTSYHVLFSFVCSRMYEMCMCVYAFMCYYCTCIRLLNRYPYSHHFKIASLKLRVQHSSLLVLSRASIKERICSFFSNTKAAAVTWFFATYLHTTSSWPKRMHILQWLFHHERGLSQPGLAVNIFGICHLCTVYGLS